MTALSPSEIRSYTAAETAAKVRSGHIAAEVVTAAYLQRVSNRDCQVRAWAYLDAEKALASARMTDGRGLLAGVPVAIKDLSDTADMPTSYGSDLYEGHRPRSDAACVSLAQAAGAVVLGKTATVEFGATRPCNTRNPKNLNHTPGGSSSGSAAAVADDQALLATGTQTGGSIIRPAAFCGVVGFKPTFGAVSPVGTRAYCWSMDTVGLFARNVEDASLFFDALRGIAKPSLVRCESPPELALFSSGLDDLATAAARRRLDEVVGKCREAGASVRLCPAPPGFERTLLWQRTISRYEMARSMSFEYRVHGDRLSSELRSEIVEGRGISEAAYREAMDGAAAMSQEMTARLGSVDALLWLATVGEAPAGLAQTGDATFNRPWSALGFPCLSLPAGQGPQALPLAVQLVGVSSADERLLFAAHWLEEMLVWPGDRLKKGENSS